jgi:hypothetical protein
MAGKLPESATVTKGARLAPGLADLWRFTAYSVAFIKV